MAELFFNHAFRLATFSLNYLSPSILADIILHPFDFATVLLQIGFDPEGLKNEATTFVSAFAQYALFTFYIPYLFTSVQGIQFMGLPHPSMFYYVTYIYNKEGLMGCYRGIMPKICERIVMMYVNETVKQAVNGGPQRSSLQISSREQEDDKFVQTLVNNLCSQFFAVLASHPFHVIMVSSFAEFMYERKSSMYKLAQGIYEVDGCYGFFIGLAPRLVGELFSLTFSLVYTGVVNRQIRNPPEPVSAQPSQSTNAGTVVGYLTDVSRFNSLKSRQRKDNGIGLAASDSGGSQSTRNTAQYFAFFNTVLGKLTQNEPIREIHGSFYPLRGQSVNVQSRGMRSLLNYLPLTSKIFYYMMIRDYISKKISYPFFLVSHCMIVLDTGWDKLPIKPYIDPVVSFFCLLLPKKRCD